MGSQLLLAGEVGGTSDNTGYHISTMAFITVGLDTSRTYNKKQPPGGACADLFGGDDDSHSGQQRKLNRMLSNVELGSDQEVTKDKKSEKVPEVAQTRIQKKSQPSVCPVTGETLGHNTAATESGIKTDKKAETTKQEKKEVKTSVDGNKEAKIVSPTEPTQPKAVSEPKPDSKESVVVTTPEATPPSAQPPAQTDTATAPATVATSPSDAPCIPAPAPAPTSVPTPATASVPTTAPISPLAPISAPISAPPCAHAPTSAPAPMKTRRVP